MTGRSGRGAVRASRVGSRPLRPGAGTSRRAVRAVSCWRWNGGFDAHSGPSSGDPRRRASRPIATSILATSDGSFTSKPVGADWVLTQSALRPAKARPALERRMPLSGAPQYGRRAPSHVNSPESCVELVVCKPGLEHQAIERLDDPPAPNRRRRSRPSSEMTVTRIKTARSALIDHVLVNLEVEIALDKLDERRVHVGWIVEEEVQRSSCSASV